MRPECGFREFHSVSLSRAAGLEQPLNVYAGSFMRLTELPTVFDECLQQIPGKVLRQHQGLEGINSVLVVELAVKALQ
jgi:hypothetical protein